MKKLLSIFGAVTLISSSTASFTNNINQSTYQTKTSNNQNKVSDGEKNALIMENFYKNKNINGNEILKIYQITNQKISINEKIANELLKNNLINLQIFNILESKNTIESTSTLLSSKILLITNQTISFNENLSTNQLNNSSGV